jgi:hypothetical protein
MCALFSKTVSDQQQEPLPFHFYSPVLQTDRLVPGIDNIRYDVSLSPKFTQFCRGFVLQLIVKHSDAAELLHKSPGPPKPTDKKEFRDQLQDLLITVLNRANLEKNPQLETLAQGAILKFLILEAQSQYADVIAQGREKLKLFQRPGQEQNPRGLQLQELVANFQRNKKITFRRLGHELLELIEEVRGDVVRKTRESFFGAEASEPQAFFSNPLIFSEDGRNDYVNLEKYVILGNYEKDPDRFELVDHELRAFLEWADEYSEDSQAYHSRQEACAEISAQMEELRRRQEDGGEKRGFLSLGGRKAEQKSPELFAERLAALEAKLHGLIELFRPIADSYAVRLDRIVSAQENAPLLVDLFRTEQQLAEARKSNARAAEISSLQKRADRQSQALERLYAQFSEAGLLPYILAAYETAKIYQDFCPPLNAQQLKEALVNPGARAKVMHLIAEYRLPSGCAETVQRAASWVGAAGPREIRTLLVRFLSDYMRYQHDLRNFRLFQELLDRIHIPQDPKQRELSEINHTLYQFLLAEEEKQPQAGKISNHVILKADIRGSTSITAELLARGLNPASYFSLNFFDPIHKLLPRYEASKVFLEGDAIILSIIERGEDSRKANSVARACCLARDMIEGVRAVNDRAAQKNLPLIELGIGICYQASAPMYLMDGERPIMISAALNESDRLSGCGKLAKQVLAQRNRFFNVFRMQLVPDADSGGASEEFLLHYNVEGIEINELAFNKLTEELALSKVELKFPLFTEPETVELYCGTLPLGPSSFQKLVVRRGQVPQLHPKTFRVLEYTDRCYYEVCSSKPVYEYVGRQLGW